MVDVSDETPSQVHRKLCDVFRKATVHHEGLYTWTEAPGPLATLPGSAVKKQGLSPDGALAFVKGQHTWSMLVPSFLGEPDRLHVIRINFTTDQDNSGFVGWLASLLKSELGSGVAVVCGYDSAHGGIFDYWCIPAEISEPAVRLLERWQGEDPPDLYSISHKSTDPPTDVDQGRGWLRLPIVVQTEAAQVKIREARTTDIDAVVSLIAEESLRGIGDIEVVRDAPILYEGALTQMRQDPNNLQLVIEGPDAEIWGCMQVTRIPGLFREGESRLHLEAIRIASAQRSHSLGSKCLSAIIEGVTDPTVRGVQLMSDARREDAVRFYERLGFVASHRGFKLTLIG